MNKAVALLDRIGSLPACKQAASQLANTIRTRSARLVCSLELAMNRLIAGWALFMLMAGGVKVLSAQPESAPQAALLLLPYLLIAGAPIAGFRIATASFPRGMLTAPLELRLSRYGTWRALDPISARDNPAFGPIGFMASLLVGILLNVPTRTLEYLVAVPAVSTSAPQWAQTYFAVMSADVIVMNFFYMVCFVLALRTNPLFPRMLLFAWVFDLMMQLLIAHRLSLATDLPGDIVQPLITLLNGNIVKVLISGVVWLPYLILSERVNVTYRSRTMLPV
ncbi:MAG: DUF2569 domain-containing protein [Novosphingobium sp.]